MTALVDAIQAVPSTRRPLVMMRDLASEFFATLRRGDRSELAEVQRALGSLSVDGDVEVYVGAWLELVAVSQATAREEEQAAAVHQLQRLPIARDVLPLLSERWCSQADVVAQTGHNKSQVSRFLRRLRAHELVEDRPSAEDGRIHELRLSPAGLDLLADSAPTGESLLAPAQALVSLILDDTERYLQEGRAPGLSKNEVSRLVRKVRPLWTLQVLAQRLTEHLEQQTQTEAARTEWEARKSTTKKRSEARLPARLRRAGKAAERRRGQGPATWGGRRA